MLRIIVRTVDSGTAAHLGGPGTPIDTSFKTFDVDAPQVEAFLRQWAPGHHIERCVVGVEVRDEQLKE